MARSPLKWTGKKSELYELLIALDNLDIITENGIKASFSSLVREFSRTVGLPYDTDCHNDGARCTKLGIPYLRNQFRAEII